MIALNQLSLVQYTWINAFLCNNKCSIKLFVGSVVGLIEKFKLKTKPKRKEVNIKYAYAFKGGKDEI